MRHPIPASLLALAVVASLACEKKAPAPAEQPATAAPAAAAPAAAAPAAAAPAAAAADPGAIDANVVASQAGLDAAALARVAPHIAAMNAERALMHALTGQVGPATPDSAKTRIHKELSAHLAAFDKHWTEATAGMSPKQKDAFDAAVREQMGARTGPVGNPHGKLPPAHPKLNPQGGAVKR
jgi:hypothetical protein